MGYKFPYFAVHTCAIMKKGKENEKTKTQVSSWFQRTSLLIESIHKGVNAWKMSHMCNNKVHTCIQLTRYINSSSLVFTCIPGESYCRWLRSLLLDVPGIFWVLTNSLVCQFCISTLCLVLFQIFSILITCFFQKIWYFFNRQDRKDQNKTWI